MGNAQVANILRFSSNLLPRACVTLIQWTLELTKRIAASGNEIASRKAFTFINLYIHQFHSISHKSYQTNKPWTRTTRSNTYNLGPERTVKRINQRRLNTYRSKWMMTYRLTVLSSNFFHFSPATLDSSVTEMPGCSCLICARASFSHSM